MDVLHLWIEDVLRLDLAGGGIDVEGIGVRPAQRVGEDIVLVGIRRRDRRADGAAGVGTLTDAPGDRSILKCGSAVLRCRLEVVDPPRRRRLSCLVAAPAVLVEGRGPQVGAHIAGACRVAARRGARNVHPARSAVGRPRPLPGDVGLAAVVVGQVCAELCPDIRPTARRCNGDYALFLHVCHSDGQDERARKALVVGGFDRDAVARLVLVAGRRGEVQLPTTGDPEVAVVHRPGERVTLRVGARERRHGRAGVLLEGWGGVARDHRRFVDVRHSDDHVDRVVDHRVRIVVPIRAIADGHDDAMASLFLEIQLRIRGQPQLPSVLVDGEQGTGGPAQRVDQIVVVQVAGDHGTPDVLSRRGVFGHITLAVLGRGERGRRVGRGWVADARRHRLSGLVRPTAVGVGGRGPDVVARVFLQRGRVCGGRGVRDVDPIRPAVGRAGPLPRDVGGSVVIAEFRGHFDASLDGRGVCGERYRSRLFHVLDRDRHGLGVVHHGGRVARAIQPVVHLEREAVTGLCLKIQGLTGLQLAGVRDDAEGGRIRVAQRVREPVTLGVLGGHGRAEVHAGRRIFRHGALAVFGGREGGALVFAEDAVCGHRLRGLAAPAVVRIGDPGAQE